MPTRALHLLAACCFTAATFVAAGAATTGCSQTVTGEPRVNVVRGPEATVAKGGLSPSKEAEVQLVLQQREASTRKCYQDVLNEKHDRAFAGTMKVLIALGTGGSATDVRVVGGTLSDPEVAGCLVDTLKRFEYPELEQAGEVQYEFQFRPAY
jgi:hypothetical protein